jgi:hypothetical protein
MRRKWFVWPCILALGACATVDPVLPLCGVWELTRVDRVKPADAPAGTSFENIKLLIRPDASLFKLGPEQQELTAASRYTYRVSGRELFTVQSDGREKRSSFRMKDDLLTIRDPDGSEAVFRRVTTQYAATPVLGPVRVPFTVSSDK